jgi:6-phosphofructokinase
MPPRANRPPPRGFYDKEYKPIVLTKKSVDGIQLQGGTILGTSRGGANIKCARFLGGVERFCPGAYHLHV